jgi:hypothetical protein
MRKSTWTAIAMLIAGPPAWFWLAPRSAINEANFAKLQLGMTQPEVAAILGGPERDESTSELRRGASCRACPIAGASSAVCSTTRDFAMTRFVLQFRVLAT